VSDKNADTHRKISRPYAIGDVGVTIIAVLNAMRILKK
jgi:hypothetical protein